MVTTLPLISLGMLVVFGLFVTELVSVDVTALIVLVSLVVLSPWTQVSPTDALSGFSNEATITVLAMLILSEGVRSTGAVQLTGTRVAAAVGSSGPKQLLATIGLAGPTSGLVNNTPVVALLVPVISDVALGSVLILLDGRPHRCIAGEQDAAVAMPANQHVSLGVAGKQLHIDIERGEQVALRRVAEIDTGCRL